MWTYVGVLCIFGAFLSSGVHCQVHNNPSHNAEESPVRLVGEGSEGGRVEMLVNGTWNTLCDMNWDEPNAQVVCRQLGHTSQLVYPVGGAFYGSGTGPIRTERFDCVGGETDLASCPTSHTTQASCTHAHDAGVLCDPYSVPIRLADGNSGYEGRVEMYVNGQWGTVCDRQWDEQDARVVCAQLGFHSGRVHAVGGAFFGEGQGKILMDNIRCTGVESHLITCPFDGFDHHSTCTHRQDAGVLCLPLDIPLRLVGEGEFPSAGRVEVQIHGDWGTVCGNNWDEQDAQVVCRQLGFNSSRAFPLDATLYGPGEGHIFMDNVDCHGGESHLTTCRFSGFDHHTCTHQSDAAVLCMPLDLPVRLVGGNEGEGRVEIQIAGQWGTVCDTYWDDKEAAVVCRQLGFTGGQVLAMSNSFYGAGSGPILMDRSQCVGNEAHLSLCPFSGFGHHTCTHADDAGVNCLPDRIGVRLVGQGDSGSEGRVEIQVNGTWGTVCDTYWDREDAEVVCRNLGFDSPYPLPVIGSFFGQSSKPLYLDHVNCVGSETHLIFCVTQDLGHVACDHGHEAGVVCQPEQLPVRLVSSGEEWEGRVEMLVDGQWGTICDDYWHEHDVEVVCRQLGFNHSTAVLAVGGAFYGEGTGRVLLSGVQCARTEPHLALCHSSGLGRSSCSHQRDASVICQPLSIETRLVGRAEGEGRVELKVNGEWSTVCGGYSWDDHAAAVVCRSLGFNSTNAIAVRSSYYGTGNGPVVLRNVDCAGSEAHLTLCPSYYGIRHHDCDHDDDVAVMCNPYSLRLVGGANEREGRVEVYVNGEWGTVCDNSWDNEDAQVVCRQLGFNATGARAQRSAHFGQGSGPIPVTGVRCTGTELYLAHCPFAGFGAYTCEHTSDAGVTCGP